VTSLLHMVCFEDSPPLVGGLHGFYTQSSLPPLAFPCPLSLIPFGLLSMHFFCMPFSLSTALVSTGQGLFFFSGFPFPFFFQPALFVPMSFRTFLGIGPHNFSFMSCTVLPTIAASVFFVQGSRILSFLSSPGLSLKILLMHQQPCSNFFRSARAPRNPISVCV